MHSRLGRWRSAVLLFDADAIDKLRIGELTLDKLTVREQISETRG